MQSNAGLIYAEGLDNWHDLEFADAQMSLTINGEQVGKATGGPDTQTIMTALTFLANHAAARNGGLKTGQVILTGARIKPTPLPLGATALATIEGIGSVSLTFE